MTERQIAVVYCDDIREEKTNKISLMGIYHDSLLVPCIPTTLPKLCAWVNVITPIDQPFKELHIRVVQGEEGTVLFDNAKIDTGTLEARQQKSIPEYAGQDSFAASIAIIMTPFQISSETFLRIIVNTEDEELRSRRLTILKSPQKKKDDLLSDL
jgi:hypothetical protein